MTSLTTAPRTDASSRALVRVTRFALRHRRLVVAFWLLATVAGIAATGPANRGFSDQFSVPGREGFETNAAIVRAFGNGGSSAPLVPVVTLPPGSSASSPAVRAGLLEIGRRIEQAVPGARIASYSSTGDRAFLSRDGRTTFLLAYPPPQPGKLGRNPRALRAVRAALHGLTVAGAPVRLTGLEALSSPTGTRKRGLGLLAESLVGGLGALLVLGFVFASLLALVPLLMAAVSIMTCFLIVLPLTKVASISPLVGFLIALVGLGVAIDYSLLIVVRWREERAHGHVGEEAIVRAMARAGRAVAFSGTTVAIGLLALIVLPLPFLRSVGYAGMLIPLISVAVALTLLPVVLAKLGPRLDWPHVRREDRASRAWTRWATLVVRRRELAAGVAVAVLAALLVAAGAMQLGPASGEPNALSQRGDASSGLHALERAGIGAGVLSPIEIVTGGDGAAPLAQRLRGTAGVQGAVAPAQAAWHRGERSLVDVLPHGDDRDTVARVRGVAHRAAASARVGGIVAQNDDFIDAVYGSFPLMLGLIALLTFVLLARAFRSLLLATKAVVLNVVSVLAAWGALTLVWQQGDVSHALWGIPATGSIPSWLPLIVFAFLYGLSMDYEVFILARMREEYDATGSTEEAVVRGIGRTGRLVTSAALILFLGFVSMATAESTTVKMIATGLGAGILLDATIVRALLVPAAVALFGRWNWWLPPALVRRQ
jgi:putative drug exporter of the RND superfamily